jgi:hypothetical protein
VRNDGSSSSGARSSIIAVSQSVREASERAQTALLLPLLPSG